MNLVPRFFGRTASSSVRTIRSLSLTQNLLKTSTIENIKPQYQPKSKLVKFSVWWSTPKGQKTAGFLMIGASIGAAMFHIAPHTVLLDFIRKNYQNYSGGIAMNTTDDMKRLLTEVTTDINLSEAESASIRLFVSCISDANGWGSLSSSCILGYPFFFNYRKVTDVPLSTMFFGRRGESEKKLLSPAERQSVEAQSLATSMILTDNARKFALARELFKNRSGQYYQVAAVNSCAILGVLVASRAFNKRIGRQLMPLLRGVAYSIIAGVSTILYWTMKDTLNHRFQTQLDQSVASLSPEYAAGGVEYYEKIMARHRAQRVLCWDGEQLYNKNGEEIYEWVRRRNKYFADRRDICQKIYDTKV